MRAKDLMKTLNGFEKFIKNKQNNVHPTDNYFISGEGISKEAFYNGVLKCIKEYQKGDE